MGWCNLFRLGRQAHFNWNAAMESASHQLLQLIKSGNLCSSIAAFPFSLLEINQFLHRTQTRWDPGREFLSFVLAETYDWFEAALNTKMNCPSPALSLSLAVYLCVCEVVFAIYIPTISHYKELQVRLCTPPSRLKQNNKKKIKPLIPIEGQAALCNQWEQENGCTRLLCAFHSADCTVLAAMHSDSSYVPFVFQFVSPQCVPLVML